MSQKGFQRGDRVRISELGRKFGIGVLIDRPNNRIGEVTTTPRHRYSVAVRWPGRGTDDRLHSDYLEKVVE